MAYKQKCDRCGREFEPGNMENGAPAGVAAKMKNGHVLTLCYYCVCEMGEKDGQRWLDSWVSEHDD